MNKRETGLTYCDRCELQVELNELAHKSTFNYHKSCLQSLQSKQASNEGKI